MPGATIGQTFTTSTGTFTEVPDALRQKTTIQLNAEIMGTLSALAGPQANTTTVLDQTFNDVDLVGRPLTIGNFVNSTTLPGLFFSVTTNTYSPYIDIGDEAYPDGSHDEVIRGTDYQEVLTNFPLASQILTGLFLNVTLSGPGGPTETYEQTLVDRIGYAVRQNGGSPSLSIDTNGPPILSNQDIYTVSVLPGLQDPAAETLFKNAQRRSRRAWRTTFRQQYPLDRCCTPVTTVSHDLFSPGNSRLSDSGGCLRVRRRSGNFGGRVLRSTADHHLHDASDAAPGEA